MTGKVPDSRQLGLDLPGLELPKGEGGLLRSAQATIEALGEAELLQPRHAITCQVVLELAAAVDRGLAFDKVSVATATLSKQLLDAIEQLPQPADDAGDADAWRQAMHDLEAAAIREAALEQ